MRLQCRTAIGKLIVTDFMVRDRAGRFFERFDQLDRLARFFNPWDCDEIEITVKRSVHR